MSMSLSLFVRLSSAALCAGLLGAGSARATEFKLGHVYEVSHPMHVAAVAAAESFKACTQGRHTIAVYPSSQLGTENALNEQVRFGGADIIFTGQIFASSAFKPLAIGAAPFIFKDRAQALRYRSSGVFKELWAGWNKATGQHILSAGYFGAFNVTSNVPVEKPQDMKGMKIRVPDAPIWLAFPRAVGANPTPVALAEVYLALQQGVVNASANPLPITYAFKFYEVQKYVNPTAHLMEFVFWIAGDHVMSKLGATDKDCMQKAADLYAERSTALIVEQEDGLRAKMEGDKLVTFTNPDIAAFQAAVAPAVEQLAKDLGATSELVARVKGI
ncbi:MAG: TRAP transporter substrate-binding protein DctP [Alsobacter sp.]